MDDNKVMQTKLVPGVGRLPYPAYRGNEPYVFVSYAHKDKDIVFPEIKRFNDAGFHVWYDEGISPGNEWSDEIAEALTLAFHRATDRHRVQKVHAVHIQEKARKCGFFPPSEARGREKI